MNQLRENFKNADFGPKMTYLPHFGQDKDFL